METLSHTDASTVDADMESKTLHLLASLAEELGNELLGDALRSARGTTFVVLITCPEAREDGAFAAEAALLRTAGYIPQTLCDLAEDAADVLLWEGDLPPRDQCFSYFQQEVQDVLEGLCPRAVGVHDTLVGHYQHGWERRMASRDRKFA